MARPRATSTLRLPSLALALALLALAPRGDAAALDDVCFPPKAQGGLGFCGPQACSASNVASTAAACAYSGAAIDYAARVSKLTCRSTCTQSSEARCSKSALASVMKGTGVKAAYCTDTHLVLLTDGTPSWTPNLDDIPNPPGSTQTSTGAACVTRSASVTPSFLQYKIPLQYTLLASASSTNNMGAFPDGAADSNAGYMSGIAGAYGLPTRGSVGVSVSGQDIFPMFNNRAEMTDDACEVDSCNEHVGGGGGQPHLHGDPFGLSCLYSSSSYSSLNAHPPQIGWSIDGPSIFGRYLSTSAPGYSQGLDDCGGHSHDSYGYHYHTQVLDTVTTTPARNMAKGLAYTASTVGVYKCWRADISKIAGFWDGNNSPYYQPCCGMTEYYTAPGITVNTGSTPAPAPKPSPTPKPGPAPKPSPSTLVPSPSSTVPSPRPQGGGGQGGGGSRPPGGGGGPGGK